MVFLEIVTSAALVAVLYKIITADEIVVKGYGVELIIKGSVIIQVGEDFDEDAFRAYLIEKLCSYGGYDDIAFNRLNYDLQTILAKTCASTINEDRMRDKRDTAIIVRCYDAIPYGPIDLRTSKTNVVSMINSYNLLHANNRLSALQQSYEEFKSSNETKRRYLLENMRRCHLVTFIEKEDMETLSL